MELRPHTCRPPACVTVCRWMVELLRTNDPVLISFVEAILNADDLGFFVADRHMSVLEGSLGFIRRRIMVIEEDAARARDLLQGAGLGAELSAA